MPDVNVAGLAPLIALSAGALAVILFDLALPRPSAARAGLIAALASVAVAGWYVAAGGQGAAFGGGYVIDRLSLGLQAVILGATALSLLLSAGRTEEDVPGYLALLLWAASGMITLVAAGTLLVAFLGLELLSLALYVLVAFARRSALAREAALKYFLLGGAASGALLFGLALIYGAAGALGFDDIGRAVAAAGPAGLGPGFRAGLALALVGLAFKLALAPFHAWAPDAYQAAPTPVTAFMSVGTKAAAFGALVRLSLAAAPEPALRAYLAPLLLLASLSMAVGSLAGLGQLDLKRLLAYSGIANAGYLSLALPALRGGGVDAAGFYLLAYLFANVGAFAVIAWLEADAPVANAADPARGVGLGDLAGLYRRRPLLAALLTLFLVSLTGLPPTGGFTGKLLLVAAGIRGLAWLPVVALVATTGISAYVYLRVVAAMFLALPAGGRGEADARARREAASAAEPLAFGGAAVRGAYGACLAICAAGTLYLGISPGAVTAALAGLVDAAR